MDVVGSPNAEPVGHQGGRVAVAQRPALALPGVLGVLVLAGCVVGAVFAAQGTTHVLWLPSWSAS